jgi:signal transduction histidine kinase/ActR/RegA family two-component response regulator
VRSKWRLFRQDGARAATLHPAVYLMLYVVSLAMGQWAKSTFGATVVWTANGVLLAGLLQFKRRDAIRFLLVCAGLNLAGNALRHDTPFMTVFNVLLNFGEVLLAGLIARRVCGAALDLRRPGRLLRFVFLAVTPATLLATALGVATLRSSGVELFFYFETWFSVEVIGLLATTPLLLLWSHGSRALEARPSGRPGWAAAEPYLLLGLVAAVTAAVFAQTVVPAPFLIFPPLLLVAYRLSPRWSAVAVFIVVLIAAFCTLNGLGPFLVGGLVPKAGGRFPAGIVPVLGALPLYNLFIAAVLLVSLPASTVLSERRRLEARLRARTETAIEARRLAEDALGAKSRFLSMMSHEMRTPLNGVAGFAELLAAQADLTPKALEQVGHIRRSSDKLLGLVEDILDFSRGDLDVTPAPFCLAATVAEAVEAERETADAKGLSLTVDGDLAPDARHIGDARRVRQVLRHLLSNAVKFTPAGAVAVRVSFEPDGVTIAIADSGPGLPSQLLDEMFDAFTQADASIGRAHEGAGLGLPLSRRLAQLMGGELKGANLAQGGAVFTLRLPLERTLDAAPAAAEMETSIRPRVLVVDDHPTNRSVACLMLETIGFEHAVACDGLEAVAAAAAEPFDLILMDVRMPNMDGLAATRAIRATPAGAGIPIIAMTADAMPEDVARCLDAGMDAHLAKPVSLKALGDILSHVLAADDDGDAHDRRLQPCAFEA